jgi:hypothetical protein
MSTLQSIAIIVGVVSGVSGVVLGIVNYWERRVSTRPRIVVRPTVVGSVPFKGFEHLTGSVIVHVSNVGQVPVIGAGIGFLRGRGPDFEFLFFETRSYSDDKWPGELKPQHTAIVGFHLGEDLQRPKLRRLYAQTVVGDVFKASRRAMRRFDRERKAARLRKPPPAAPCTSAQAADTPA